VKTIREAAPDSGCARSGADGFAGRSCRPAGDGDSELALFVIDPQGSVYWSYRSPVRRLGPVARAIGAGRVICCPACSCAVPAAAGRPPQHVGPTALGTPQARVLAIVGMSYSAFLAPAIAVSVWGTGVGQTKRTQGKLGSNVMLQALADGVGFEPTRGVNPCRFSRPVPSTARPPIRAAMASM
jgi:hypothetical protein